jgi:hypothetical protein
MISALKGKAKYTAAVHFMDAADERSQIPTARGRAAIPANEATGG